MRIFILFLLIFFALGLIVSDVASMKQHYRYVLYGVVISYLSNKIYWTKFSASLIILSAVLILTSVAFNIFTRDVGILKALEFVAILANLLLLHPRFFTKKST